LEGTKENVSLGCTEGRRQETATTNGFHHRDTEFTEPEQEAGGRRQEAEGRRRETATTNGPSPQRHREHRDRRQKAGGRRQRRQTAFHHRDAEFTEGRGAALPRPPSCSGGL
jgi:hypothetical protein